MISNFSKSKVCKIQFANTLQNTQVFGADQPFFSFPRLLDEQGRNCAMGFGQLLLHFLDH